jgi:AbiV family abortive infection protein
MSPEFSEEVLRQAATACFRNAESHRGAALALFEKDFRAQAVALAAIGIEEFAKSILYAVAALVPEQRKDVPSTESRIIQ